MATPPRASAHVQQLGYLGFETAAPDAWESFATKVLGLGVGQRFPDGGFTLRMDSYAQRLFVTVGPKEDVSVIGWEVTDEAALAEIVLRLEKAGYPVTKGTPEEASLRQVTGLVKFRDPAGTASELFFGPKKAAEPFKSELLVSHFVAEAQGLGHAVVTSKDKKQSTDFYRDLLGFRLSDDIVCKYYGYDVDLSFFHAGTRHHSVAIGGRQEKRIHHFMLEVASMDDVGLCFDRALKAGVPIMQTLGRHPNDRMFSFYAKTPSGIQFEFGWGGREVDDATWTPKTYDRISEWGHHPPVAFAPRSPAAAAAARAPRGAERREEEEAMTTKAVPEGKYADVGDGLRIHYHEAGKGFPVVFIHGSGPGASGWSNFKGCYPAFAEGGFRAIVPDTLGFGYSSKPEDVDYDFDFVLGGLKRFLKGLGVNQCALVGNSHGGAMSIQLALDEPALVSKLILMAPGGLEERERYMEMKGIRSMMKAVLAPEGITRDSMRKVFGHQLYDASGITDAIIEERFQIASTQPKRVLSSLRVPHLAPRLGELECPVLAFWGNEDQFCPVSGATTLSERCKKSRVMRISQCGHWVMVEHTRMFNAISLGFLGE